MATLAFTILLFPLALYLTIRGLGFFDRARGTDDKRSIRWDYLMCGIVISYSITFANLNALKHKKADRERLLDKHVERAGTNN